MKFIFKCISIFVVLTFLFIVAEPYLIGSGIVFSGKFLLSSAASLILTIFYGWIDAVFIKQRQPKIKDAEGTVRR